MARPAESRADSARRDTPEGFVKYMCAHPAHFRELFGKPLSEKNLTDELKRRFPGRVIEEPQAEGGDDMGKQGNCANCRRVKTLIKEGMCGTCNAAAAGKTGQAREKALLGIKQKIDRGDVKPRGIRGNQPPVARVDNSGTFSKEAHEKFVRDTDETVRRAVAGERAVKPGSPSDSRAKVEAQLRGLLRLIDETAQMGLATEITVNIRIGGRT